MDKNKKKLAKQCELDDRRLARERGFSTDLGKVL